MIDNIEESRITECEFCRLSKECNHIPDPYAHELDDDDTLHWICSDYAYERFMDT